MLHRETFAVYSEHVQNTQIDYEKQNQKQVHT